MIMSGHMSKGGNLMSTIGRLSLRTGSSLRIGSDVEAAGGGLETRGVLAPSVDLGDRRLFQRRHRSRS